MRAARQVSRLSLILLAFVSVVIGLSPPAHADPGGPWSSETAMRNAPAVYRDTWLVEPGIGNFMERDQLVRADNLYNSFGFSQQFRWYAPEAQVTIDDPGQQWAYCDNPSLTNEFCPPGDVRTSNNGILNSFGPASITLHTFSFDGRHIARVCGNFFHRGGAHTDPVPHLTIEKFDDRDRNGVRDGDESGISGWEFRIVRESSTFDDQGLGHVGTVHTGAGGAVEFRFDGHGPGLYRIEEVGRAGWAPTTASVQHVVVNPGIGDASVGTFRFGNAETIAELIKVDFALVDPPSRLEADSTTDLTVRAVIRNDGPADVSVRDSIDVVVPDDCTASPAHAEVVRYLVRGASATVDFTVSVMCTEPSWHPMTFTDHLLPDTPGVQDPDLSNNTLSFEHVFPVFDRADITLAGNAIACPPRSDVGQQFTCTTSASVGNAGPYGPVNVDVSFALGHPGDCTVSSTDNHQSVSLAAGQTVTVTANWQITCAQRSFHDFLATAEATLNHLHVEDPVSGNTSGSAPVIVEIFEPADLSVSALDIRCAEREHNTTASQCTATVVVTNGGPANAVALMANLTITPEPGCTASPSAAVDQPMTLNAGQSQTMTATWALTCQSASRHAVRVTASVRTDEPHAEDRDLTNNTTTAIWGPGDIKPRSLPSSINIGKNGLVPFAVLSTATFDATTQVDRSSLTFGHLGTEDSVQSCAAQAEDVNDDGRPDLVCHAETQLMGLTCGTETVRLIGLTSEGIRFYSEDAVKIVGCH